MTKRKRRAFSPEFKVEAVRLCHVGGRSIAQVAKDRGALSARSSSGGVVFPGPFAI
jgi:transposase-like protein